MQSKELLLRNTPFLLAFHALCAKTMQLGSAACCSEGLQWLKKLRHLSNSGLGDMLKGVL